MKFLTFVVCYLLCCVLADAQIAADSAQNYPATSGSGIWNNGDNFGFGFQPWQFITSGSGGMFLGDSTQNGGNGLGNPGSSGGINSANLRSWGVFGNSGGTADAVRPFQSALGVGQTFSVDFDNGFIDTGASEGITLANANGVALWQFLFIGGQNTYTVVDAGGAVPTLLPFTADGMHIDFTLTGTTTYSATVSEADGPTQAFTGSLASTGQVNQFAFFDHNGGFNSSNNAYANNLVITGAAVPEPGVVTLSVFGALIAVLVYSPSSINR